PMFDLENDVVEELPVELLEVVVGCGRPVVFEVAPVHVMVIHETSVENDAAMFSEGPRYDIRSVGVAAVISGGAQPPFRVGLGNEAPEIGNRAVNSVDRFLPEIGDTRVQRIESIESANLSRAAEFDRYEEPDAPGPECFCEPGKLRQKCGGNDSGIGVDVVDRAGIDTG